MWLDENIACRAIKTASFLRDDFDSLNINGYLEEGTDKLTIKITDVSTLNFITTASVETGTIEPSPMNILTNNDYVLIANSLESNKFLDSITISKVTGLGVWQSVNAAGLPMTYEIPDSQMIYLKCIVPKLSF